MAMGATSVTPNSDVNDGIAAAIATPANGCDELSRKSNKKMMKCV